MKNHPAQKGANYICGNCGAQEIIPADVLEEFDQMFPEQILYGPHTFECQKCDRGLMQPKHHQTIVKGYGLYEDIDYTIKTSKPKKRKNKKYKKGKKHKK